MIFTSTLTADMSLPVPAEVARRMGWQAGQLFVFVVHGINVQIEPTTPELLAALRADEAELDGMFGDLDEEDEAKADLAIEDLRGAMRGADPTGYRDRDDRY
jgi:bifunctional DNA-binding transcriptional regulator/antitoxin component of YhaV-PrlF toxin-antitoxin module